MRPLARTIFLICLNFIFVPGFLAQSKASIHGLLKDAEGPVELANVILSPVSDSIKVTRFITTDSSGSFNLNEIPYGNYILKVQMIGYVTQRFKVQLDSLANSLDLKTIDFIPDKKLLQAVDIVTHKELVQKTTQGFIINAADNISQAGGTATDLLRNTPTVVVDADGNISIRGKAPLILVNGRNSSLSATDRIPASSIETIEIINNPSAQYDADADGGIINIKLKKNTDRGTNGSFVIGGGLGDHGRFNSAFMINHRTKKWNFGLLYDNRFAERTRRIASDRTNFYIPSDYSLLQNRHDDNYDQTQNLKCSIDFTPNEKNNFSFELIGNLSGQNNNETLVSLFETQASDFVSKNSRFSNEVNNEKTLEGAFNYSKKFNDKRKSLTINLSSSYNPEIENTNINTQSLANDDSFVGAAFLQRTSNNQVSSVSNARIDFAQPLGKKGILEMGYKGIGRYSDDNFKSQYFQDPDYISDPRASNEFIFKEQVHAAYLQYRGIVGKPDSMRWKYDVGLRVEQVFNQGKTTGASPISFNRNYFNFFPTANIVYYVNPSDFLKLSFSRRINRPGLGQLNPFTDITDSLNPHSGNPNLGPELINALEAGYNKEFKKVSLSAIVFYRYATNVIKQYTELQSNGVALRSPKNFGSSETYGLEGIVSVFPVKFWSFNMSVSLYQQNINGSNVSSDVANSVLSWYGKMINNFTLWKGSKLQLIANYNSPVASPQGASIAVYNVDLGFQQKIAKGKGAIGLVVTDIFNVQKSGQTNSTIDFSSSRISKTDTRAVLLTFAYSFRSLVKEALLENKFSND